MTATPEEPLGIEELRTSVISLAARVQGLSASLDLVNEVQRSQQHLDRRTLEAMEEARRATAAAESVRESTIPRTEVDERDRVDRLQTRRHRRKTLLQMFATGLLIFVFVSGLLLLVLSNVNYQRATRGQLRALKQQTAASCETRNKILAAQRNLYAAQIDAEEQNHTPGIQPVANARIAGYQAALNTLPSPVDCQAYLR